MHFFQKATIAISPIRDHTWEKCARFAMMRD